MLTLVKSFHPLIPAKWENKNNPGPLPQQGSLHLDNNILTRAAGGRAPARSEILRKGVVIMSTYEELQLITSVAMLIVAILTYTHKK